MQTLALNRFVTSLLVFLATLLIGGCTSIAPLHKETRTRATAHSPSAPIRVVTTNGAVSLKSSDRDNIQVTANISATTSERLQSTKIVTEKTANGVLSIWVQWPGDKALNREGCSFEILAPNAYGATIQTSNGRIVLSGLSGDAVLNTSNGEIKVHQHTGSVNAKTSNGAVTVEDISGDATLRTSNGKIRAISIAGTVSANTSNGAISIDMAPDSNGSLKARTSNGPITLTLSEQFSGELKLNTSNGGIKTMDLTDAHYLSSSKNHLHLQLGDSNQYSEAITSNGTVTVKGFPQ